MATELEQARRRSVPPPRQLCEELVRMKRKGLAFDHAWRIAQQRIVWPHDKENRHEWKRVLLDTRPAWESCYLGIGSPLDINALIDGLIDARDEDLLVAA